MANLIIIAAVGKNGELGVCNRLVWHLKGDLKFFKEQTMDHKIVMGYNTFASLAKLLPLREHLILTHRNLQIDGVRVFKSYEEIMGFLEKLDEDVYVIGGASIYELFMVDAREILLTEIDEEFREADVYFPKFNKHDYIRDILDTNRENDINYTFVRYRRK